MGIEVLSFGEFPISFSLKFVAKRFKTCPWTMGDGQLRDAMFRVGIVLFISGLPEGMLRKLWENPNRNYSLNRLGKSWKKMSVSPFHQSLLVVPQDFPSTLGALGECKRQGRQGVIPMKSIPSISHEDTQSAT